MKLLEVSIRKTSFVIKENFKRSMVLNVNYFIIFSSSRMDTPSRRVLMTPRADFSTLGQIKNWRCIVTTILSVVSPV